LRGETSTKGDGVVRVFDIFQHVSVKVPQATSDRQHPIFKASDLETNFPVSLDKGGSKGEVVETTNLRPENDSDWNKLEIILSDLYPTGPTDQDIWRRAGGDLSRLRLNQSGRASWFTSLLLLRQGGGGNIRNFEHLVRVALEDFPNHNELKTFLASKGY
jgi:hypothetical protein